MKLRTILSSFADTYMHRTAMVATFCLAAACGFPRPADVPDPGACTANEFVACEGNIVRTCNATGDGTTTQDCGAAGCNADAKRCNQCVPNSDSCGAGPNEIDHCGPDGLPAGQDTCQLACMTTPSAHCAYLEPRYLPDICDKVATEPVLTVNNLAHLDTGLDTNCNGGIARQEGAADICVLRYRSIDITMAGTLAVTGVRALALVADDAITIDGLLDVSARNTGNGPGGGTVTSGAFGGGAGFATAGGSGGSATMAGGGGAGGPKSTDPAIITVLIGGSRSTRGFLGMPDSGGGGGAATLIACRGSVSVKGAIAGGGGGGGGGKSGLTSGVTFGGAGGGAGGNVALQGLSITVTGQVFANGGGGGAGWLTGNPTGDFGTDGLPSATTAAPGGTSFAGTGAGGAGGLQGIPPGDGLPPSASGATPGGGGGSIGFFQTYTPSGILPTLTPSAASPTFSPNKEIKVH